MASVIPLVIQRLNSYALNEEALYAIGNATNPHIITFFGQNRIGKSTLQNNIIKGCIDGMRFVCEDPFEAKDTVEIVTTGCNLYGPIKLSELARRNMIEIETSGDPDIFLCDTEGLEALSGLSKNFLTPFLTILNASSVVVPVASTSISVDQVKLIGLLSAYCKGLQPGKTSVVSKIIVYVTGVKGRMGYIKSDNIKKLKKSSKTIQKDVNKILLSEDNHNIYATICSSQFIDNTTIDQTNEYLYLYWYSIKQIVKTVNSLITERGSQKSADLVESIKTSFDFFADFGFNEVDNMDSLASQMSRCTIEKFDKELLKAKAEIINYANKSFEESIKLFNEYNYRINKIQSCISPVYNELFMKGINSKIYTDSFNKIADEIHKICANDIKSKFNAIIQDIINKYIKNLFEKKQYIEDFNVISQSTLDHEVVQSRSFKPYYEMISESSEKEDIFNLVSRHASDTYSVVKPKVDEKNKEVNTKINEIDKKVECIMKNATNTSKIPVINKKLKREDFIIKLRKEFDNEISKYRDQYVIDWIMRVIKTEVNEYISKYNNDIQASTDKLIRIVYVVCILDIIGIIAIISWIKWPFIKTVYTNVKTKIGNIKRRVIGDKKEKVSVSLNTENDRREEEEEEERHEILKNDVHRRQNNRHADNF